jgi:short-subunit dehydrogenase
MSKAAVRALADSLRYELRASGVSVTLIAPGFVASEIRRVSNEGVLQIDRREPIPAWLIMPSAAAARRIVRAIEARRAEAVITAHGKVLVQLARHAPWTLRLLSHVVRVRR